MSTHPRSFLLICNVYAFDGYLPSGDVLRRADLRNIVKYLHRSHAYYMDNALAGLADDIERLIAPCDDRRKQVIRKFFTDYKEELARPQTAQGRRVNPEDACGSEQGLCSRKLDSTWRVTALLPDTSAL